MNNPNLEHVVRIALASQGLDAFDATNVSLVSAESVPRIERGLVVRIVAGYLAAQTCSSAAASERLVAWLKKHPDFELSMFDTVHDALLYAGFAAHLSRASFALQLRSQSKLRQPLLQRVRDDIFCHAVDHSLDESASGFNEARRATLLHNRDSFLSYRTESLA